MSIYLEYPLVVIDAGEVEFRAWCLFEGCFNARKSIYDNQVDYLQLAIL